MTQITRFTSPSIGPLPQACLAPAAEPVVSATSSDSRTDRLLRLTNYGVGGAGSVAGLVAIPNQVVKYAPAIMKSVTGIGLYAAVAGATQPGLVGTAAKTIARGSLFVVKNTDHLSKLAGTVMKAPVVGRLFSPQLSDAMTGKVLPTVNAVGAGISVLDNGNRFYKARKADNAAGQLVAGTQVALNLTSAVTGFLPGKAQWVSAGAGLASLGLEVAHQLGGLGK